MSHYAKLIVQQLPERYRDDATAAVVEEFMRTDRAALDDLTPDELASEVREWVETFDNDPYAAATVRGYCGALRLAVPMWAAS